MIVEDLRILLWCASAAARLIAADRLILRLGNDGLLWEKTEAESIDRLCQHHAATVRFELWSDNRVRTHDGGFSNRP